MKELSRAHDWRLAPATSGALVPIAVTVPSAPDTLELDLSKAKIAPGDYHLQATWDWSPLDIGGVLHVHPYGDFAHLEIAPEFPAIALGFPGLMMINGTFMHVLPFILKRGRFSPGLITSILLFWPVGALTMLAAIRPTKACP